MSCRWCVHWAAEDKYHMEYGKPGECRRYPHPQPTAAEYVCGEFQPTPESAGSGSLTQQFFESMNSAREDYYKERETRISLEKKLKVLRKKMKQAESSKDKP